MLGGTHFGLRGQPSMTPRYSLWGWCGDVGSSHNSLRTDG